MVSPSQTGVLLDGFKAGGVSFTFTAIEPTGDVQPRGFVTVTS